MGDNGDVGADEDMEGCGRCLCKKAMRMIRVMWVRMIFVLKGNADETGDAGADEDMGGCGRLRGTAVDRRPICVTFARGNPLFFPYSFIHYSFLNYLFFPYSFKQHSFFPYSFLHYSFFPYSFLNYLFFPY